MSPDYIEQHILQIAEALQNQVSEEEIVDDYLESDFQDTDILLLLIAAKQLLGDRESVPERPQLFRRST